MNQEIVHDPAIFQIGLKVALRNQDGEMLLLKFSNARKVSMADDFDLPGGRINTDELELGFHELIDREMKEEVGLDVKYKLRPDPVALGKSTLPAKYFPEEDKRNRFFILFEAEYLGGKITLCEEHTDYAWKRVTAENVNELFPPLFQGLMHNYFKWNQ